MTRRALLSTTALALVPPAPALALPRLPGDYQLEDGTWVELKTSQTGATRRARLQAFAYEQMTGTKVHLSERAKP